MANELIDAFNLRMKRLDPNSKRRFLHGVYKQLATSHNGRQATGEYKNLSYGMPTGRELNVRNDFITFVASQLTQYGFTNHSLRLLKQNGFNAVHKRLKHTLTELQKIEPNWKQHASIYLFDDGVQLDYGEYQNKSRFSTSIVLHGRSYGNCDNPFEIQPKFDGKKMDELGLANDAVAGWIPLEKAVAIAHATLSRDKARFEGTIKNMYE